MKTSQFEEISVLFKTIDCDFFWYGEFMWPLQKVVNVTSNEGIKRSRIESPAM